jgi:type II secretory pathway pseudopilin PulG
VQANSPNKRKSQTGRLNPEAGVTILEMAIATIILSVGLFALAASIGYAIAVSNKGRNLTNTKLVAVSMLEQMETLRNTGRLTFGQIANVGAVDNTNATRNFAGFPTGFQPVSINPGPDGIFGTSDDLMDPTTTPPQTQPTWAISGCSREIVITNLSSTLKRVQVTLQYQDSGGQTRNLVAVSYLNDDTRSNFR